MPPRPAIPATLDAFTTDWFQSALAHAGHDVELRTVQISPIGTGQMATSLRVALDTVEATDELPDSIVVKTPSTDENSRAAGARGAYMREVRFYQQLQQSVDVCTPQLIFGDIDPATDDFVLLLEDLHPALQGDQILGCSFDQAQLAALNIAGLHGPSWCDESLRDHAWLTPPADEAAAAEAFLLQILGELTEGFILRYADRLAPGHPELLRFFADRAGDWLALGRERFALTHADHRLDNLLFGTSEGGYPVSAVDWQTVGLRNPLADVSYLLGTGLEPETRRSVERSLVEEYRAQLATYDIGEYSASLCFEDYAAQSFHALLITVLGSMMTGQTPRGDDMFMAMLRRSATQIDDLDARSLLP